MSLFGSIFLHLALAVSGCCCYHEFMAAYGALHLNGFATDTQV